MSLRTRRAVAAVGLAAWLGCGPEPPVEPPPEPPILHLSGVEPKVRESLEAAVAGVEASPTRASTWGRLGVTLQAHDFLPEAVEAYAEAAILAPGDARWLYLGARAVGEVDPDRRRSLLEQAVALRPANPAVYLALADDQVEEGDLEGARLLYERALEVAPDAVFARFGLARVALLEGRPGDSAALLDEALARRPTFREAHLLLAQVARRLGDEELARLSEWRAENHPGGSTPRDPDWALVETAGVSARWAAKRGLAYARAGRFEEAEAEFRAVLEAIDGSATDHANLAGALIGSGRLEEAEAVLAQALALDPEAPGAVANSLRLRLARGDVDGVLREIEAAPGGVRRDVEVELNLGVALTRLGRLDEAIDLAEGRLAAAPGDLRALRLLGEAQIRAGRPQAAIDPLSRVVAIEPEDLDARWNLASAAASAGDHGLAVTQLRQAMGRAPNSSRVGLFLAWELATASDPAARDGAEATALAQRVRAAYPDSARAADVLAASLAEVGEWSLAVATAEEGLELARRAGDEALARAIDGRIALFRAEKAYRQEDGGA